MWGNVKIKTAGALPLTGADLRARLRIDYAGDDDLLVDFLAAAASEIEGPGGVGVAMLAQTWTLTLDRWAPVIRLPGWPVTGVTQVRYLDAAGDEVILDHATVYRQVLGMDPARLVQRTTAALPVLLPEPGVIAVDYTLGMADVADVDAGLVTALALLAGHYYENREAVTTGTLREVPLGVAHILGRFRRGVVG